MGLSLAERARPRAGLEEVLARLAKLEQGYARKTPRMLLSTGWEEIDQRLEGGLATGAVHEWLTAIGAPAERDRSGPFTGTQGACFWRPPLSILIHLAWQALVRDPQKIVLWIGRSYRPYGRALVRHAGQPHEDRLLLEQSIFLDVPAVDLDARLWAIDLAARSPAAACVIADAGGLDMRASRRLQLAAQHGSALVLLARPANELQQLSAAATRWTVAHRHEGLTRQSPPARATIVDRPFLSSAHHFITSSHHLPSHRWTVALLRCKGLQPVRRGHELPCAFVLEVCRETGSLRLSSDVVDRSGSQAPEESHRARLRRIA